MKAKWLKIFSVLLTFAMLMAPLSIQGGAVAGEAGNSEAAEATIYLIRLADAPLAAYKGGISDLAPTSPGVTGQRKLDANSPASRAYLEYLDEKHSQFVSIMESSVGHTVEVLYHYYAANNGLAVYLTAEEAAIVEKLPDVVFIQPNFQRELQTDAGPEFIGAPGIWEGLETGGLPGTYGEGIIIGVIDTGINPSNPSFADVGADGYDHENPFGAGNYVGVCNPADANYDPTFPCNDKLIGAHGYAGHGYEARDYDGHGSHTSSTAGGNFVYTATVKAPTLTITRSISGVAPHANIIAYTACCSGADLSAAIDDTILDGVDVINYSIGSSAPSDPWLDFDAVGYLNAREAGIFVATSAGNNGPGADTVGSPADVPWLTSVGASTHDRAFLNVLQDMSGGDTTPPADIMGKGLTVGYGPAPIVYAGDYGDALCLNPFPPGTWTGEIVVCDRGIIARVAKGQNVLAGGAGGLVLANMPENGYGFGTLSGDSHYLPAVHITTTDGDTLKSWLATGSNHTATISGVTFSPDYPDIMAGFSSRGGNRALPDILVPSVAAPGVDIIAAYGTNDSIEWNVISGTSMASPHVAGAGALLMSLHPEWTVAEVQSALMTTAWMDVLKEDETPADPFDMGSGRIDLSVAGKAGLVLDESIQNYWDADPDMGGDPASLNLPSMAEANCIGTCSWTREVRSTSAFETHWTASVNASGGLTLTVEPELFTLAPFASQVLTVTADVSSAPLDIWTFGNVSLTNTDSEIAYLKVAHLAPFAMDPGTAVTVTMNGAPALTNFAYGDSTTYLPVTPDTYLVEVFPAGSSTPAMTATVDLMDDMYYTAIATGDGLNQPLELIALVDDLTAPAAGNFKLRIGHLAPFASVISDTLADIRLQDGTPVLENVPYGAVTDFIELPAGTYDMKITTPGGGTTLIDPLPVALSEGQILSGYATGDGANQDLGAYALPSVEDMMGFFMPLADYGVVLSGDMEGLGIPGETVSYMVTITNTGNTTDTFDVDVAGVWTAVPSVTNLTLSSGETDTFMVDVTVPAGAEEGDMDVTTVSVTSLNDPAVMDSTSLTTTAMEEVFYIYLPLVFNTSSSSAVMSPADRANAPTLNELASTDRNYDVMNLITSDLAPEAHLPVAVLPEDFPPIIDVDPTEVSQSQPPDDVTTQNLTIFNLGDGRDLEWEIIEDVAPPLGLNVPLDWADNFDSYPVDSSLHGVGGWKGWDNDPAYTAYVRDEYSNSSPHSVEIVGVSDLVHEYSGYTDGLWVYSAWQYVPTGTTGQSYFILLNTYADGGDRNWSTQVWFDGDAGLVHNTGASGGELPLVYDQWVELRVEIDLINDTQEFYYNNDLLYAGTWTDEVSGDGALNIGAVDLFANGASEVYYDDIELVVDFPEACQIPTDIPWLTVDPSTGVTPAGDSDLVELTFDSTGLSPDLYESTLCVNSNDPVTPLLQVPVTLEVTAP